jgi:hypothetical protein
MLEAYFPYDRNLPPPEEVTIPLQKWDEMRIAISDLITCHQMLWDIFEFTDTIWDDVPDSLQKRITHWKAHRPIPTQ